MSPSSVQIEMRDSTVGVTTRSRKRVRDEADASSPSGDLHDRKRSRLQPPSVPVRRSLRHAAIAASKADGSTRHPEPGSETPSTSRSSSLVEAESDSAQASTSSLTANDTSDVRSSDRRITPSAHTASTLRVPQDVDSIDLTNPWTALKRKRSAVTDDDADAEDQVTSGDILDTHTSKKAKVDISDNATVRGAPSVSRSRLSRRRNSKLVEDASMATNEPSSSSMQSLPVSVSEASSNEVHTVEDDPQDFETDSSLRAHEPAQEIFGDLPEDSPVADDKAETSSEDNGSSFSPHSSPAPNDTKRPPPPQLTLVAAENPSAPSSRDDAQQCEESPQPQPTPALSPQDDAQQIAFEEVSPSQPTPSNEIISQPFPQDDAQEFAAPCGQPSLAEGIESTSSPQDDANGAISTGAPEFQTGDDRTADLDDILTSSPPSSAGRSEGHRYYGVDAKFVKAWKPSSYLAPSPNRTPREIPPPRKSGLFAKDIACYVDYATENAGKVTFSKTGRQFPVWMTRPSRVYFNGRQFIPGGRPATVEDLISEEIDVGMHIDGPLASPSVPDEFLSQGQLFPSTSTCTTPQMVLDPELDPSSLVDGQASFDTQGAPTDFLGAGHGPDLSSQSASFPDGQPEDHLHPSQPPFYPSQLQRHPQQQFHPAQQQFHPTPQQFYQLPQQFCQLPQQFCQLPQQFCQLPQQFHQSAEQEQSQEQAYQEPPYRPAEQFQPLEGFCQEQPYEPAEQFQPQEQEQQPAEQILAPHEQILAPHEQLWPLTQGTFAPTQEQYASEYSLAGPSNGSASTFQASGSGVPTENTHGDLQGPSDVLQCPLFGFMPLVPPGNMSSDSSLSAMVTYFATDTSSLTSSLDTSNIIDGIPPVASPQSYQATPNMRQMDDSGDME